MKRLAGGAVFLALAGIACDKTAERKAEAQAVNHAVTSLRDADNAKKRELLGELRALSCSAPEVCAVRSACLAAYELHVGVMDRVREAKNADGGDPAALETLKAELKRSLDLTGTCTDAQGEMIRHYKL